MRQGASPSKNSNESSTEVVSLKTTKGERIDVVVPLNATVQQAIAALVDQHHFHPTTKLMGGREILDPSRRVNEFADGSLLVVGATTENAPRGGPKIRATHHHAHHSGHPSQSVDTENAPQGRSHSTSPRKAAHHSSPTTPEPRSATPQSSGHILIKGVIPAMQKVIDIPLESTATVADLLTAALSIDSRLIGCRLAFRGKFVVGPTDKSLHSCGIRDGDAVHLATGEFCDVNVLSLFRIEEDLGRIREQISNNGQELTELQRKGIYEELMRVLFRTDELQEVEGDLRLRRKELVKSITQLQDMLKPSH